jgi:hypothetical protein
MALSIDTLRMHVQSGKAVRLHVGVVSVILQYVSPNKQSMNQSAWCDVSDR